MLELQTSVFAGLLRKVGMPFDCDDCDGRACHSYFSLTVKGDPNFQEDHPDTVVSWPECPRHYATYYQAGADILPLHSIVEWHHALGHHKAEHLGAGGARLYREWLRTKDLPERLLEARTAEGGDA